MSKGLTETHRRYSFLQTASEELAQNESDSESLAEETRYQWELQKRVRETQKKVSRAYGGESEESMEQDSLEDMNLGEEESDEEETQRLSEDQGERGNPENESTRENIVDEYSELRYNPNWKDSPQGRSFLELEDSHRDQMENFSFTSLDLACCPSQGGIPSKNFPLQESPRNTSSAIAGELWSPFVDGPGDSRPSRLDEKGRKAGIIHHYDSSDSLASSSCRVRFKEPKPRPEKDFIEKNKNMLALATQQNRSYLRLHGKQQREGGSEEKDCLIL